MQASNPPCDCGIAVPADLQHGSDIAFRHKLKELVDHGSSEIRLDCSALDPVHSSHIGLLWQARETCEEAEIALLLNNAKAGLVRSLEVLDLLEFFTLANYAVKPDRDEEAEPHAVPSVSSCRLTFAATPAGVDEGLEDFLAFLRGLPLAKETAFDLRTAFYEVATNIRSHAGVNAGVDVAFDASLGEQGLTMVFRDRGVPFDPVSREDTLDLHKAAQDRQTRGFGLSLIKRLIDDWSYEYTDNANVLTLIKKCGGE